MARSLATRLIGSSYHDLLVVDSSTTGLNTNIQNIMDGDGSASPIHMSTTKFKYQASGDYTDAVSIYDAQGNVAFQVDTSNRKVKAGKRDEYISPGILDFYHWGKHDVVTAGEHYAMTRSTLMKEQVGILLGNGTDPDTTYTTATHDADAVHGTWLAPMCYAQLKKAIVIDNIHMWYTGKYEAGASTAATFNAHVMEYTADLTGFTNGALSAGSLVAHSTGGALSAASAVPYHHLLSLDATEIDADVGASGAGKCLVPTIEHVVLGDNDIIVRMTIEYHLQ